MTETPRDNLCVVSDPDELRKSLLRITDPKDLNRLPYGTIIVTGVKECPGILTLMKSNQDDWRVITIYGNPYTVYQIEEDDETYTPDLPALLVLCGEELPEEPTQRHLVLVKGGVEEPESP